MTQPPLGHYEWPPLPILDPEAAATILAERLHAAYDDLQAELERVLADPRTIHRRGLVEAWIKDFQAAIEAFKVNAAAEVQRFIDLHLVPRYVEGAETVLGGQPMTWTGAHETAVTSLALDTYDDFLQRSNEAGRASDEMVRIVREASRSELPKAATGARTAEQAADRLEEKILEAGLDHVVYRDGTEVPVRHYARMAARTKSAVAFNAGTLNELHALGVVYVEVFDGRDCGWRFHDDEDKASRSIRTVIEAASHPISHPNCRRAFGGRPDITTEEDAATAEPFGKDLDDGVDGDLAPTPAVKTRAREEQRRRRQEKRQQRITGTPTEDPTPIADQFFPADPITGVVPPFQRNQVQPSHNAWVHVWGGDELNPRKGRHNPFDPPLDLPGKTVWPVAWLGGADDDLGAGREAAQALILEGLQKAADVLWTEPQPQEWMFEVLWAGVAYVVVVKMVDGEPTIDATWPLSGDGVLVVNAAGQLVPKPLVWPPGSNR